jgi:hypothetical protein
MAIPINEKKLIEIFIFCDDFDKSYELWLRQRSLGESSTRTRLPAIGDSEVLTLLIFYHWSDYMNFQYFCERFAQVYLMSYFPGMPSL